MYSAIGSRSGAGTTPPRQLQHAAAHLWVRCAAALRIAGRSGPAGADGVVGVSHVVAGRLHLLTVSIGLLIDHLEVAAQLRHELLAGHRTGTTPEITGSQHIMHNRLMLRLQRGSLGTNQRTVGVDITELVVDRHLSYPP